MFHETFGPDRLMKAGGSKDHDPSIFQTVRWLQATHDSCNHSDQLRVSTSQLTPKVKRVALMVKMLGRSLKFTFVTQAIVCSRST